MAPFSARSHLSASSILTTFDVVAARGYVDIPQVERAPSHGGNILVYRPKPLGSSSHHQSLQCCMSSHPCPACHGNHAGPPSQSTQTNARGSSDLGLMQELRIVTDFTLRATKITARYLGKLMFTLVAQECCLSLNLVDMRDVDKICFLDTPISQIDHFGDAVKDFVQQFSAVQRQNSAHPAPLRPAERLHPMLRHHQGWHIEPL